MTDTQPGPRWVDVDAAAKYLDVHPRTLLRYAAQGLVTRGGIGGTTRYDLNELDAILRGDQTTPEKAAADALDTVRARIPTGRPLIPVASVLEILDAVTAEINA
jgi:DNA-binding transcriptional MerR regulator